MITEKEIQELDNVTYNESIEIMEGTLGFQILMFNIVNYFKATRNQFENAKPEELEGYQGQLKALRYLMELPKTIKR